MVYTPRKYLLPAAVALVAMQVQQASAASLYYVPETTSGTDGTISGKSPFRGGDVADQDCVFTVEVDPTLPDIANISTVPVTYPDLLANTTTAPAQPVSGKVGTPVIQETTPATNEDQDVYTTTTSTTQGTPATKTGVTTPATQGSTPATKTGVSTPTEVQGESDAKPKDCATGWEDSKPTQKRRLEANTNKDIAKLEAYFGTTMEMTLKNLPTTCVHSPAPWPGPYWPTYQDGINVEWNQGQPSPAEKYATAFGLDVTDFMDKVSKDNGIDSMSSRTKCSSDSDCSGLSDGSACAIRSGKSSGYCIPTWYGICHAWTPASMLEEEPKCAVTHNGVTFQPMDLKALLSDIYDGASVSTVFTGARFNGGSDSTDGNGRHSNAAFRDLNPGYFHIAATNLLGNLNATFIADVTAGSEVWNQPVRGFKVYEQTEMTLEEAAQTFYGLESYPYNAAAKSIVYVKSRLSWIFETYTDGGLVSSGQVDSYTTGAYYYYLLEMDDAGKIIGGEWVYNSDDEHPDFLWFPKAKPAADTVTSIGLSYADVSMLLKKSVACSDSSSSGSTSGSAGSAASTSSSASTSGSVSSSSASVAGSASTGSAPAGSASTGSAPAGSTSTGSAPAGSSATSAPAGSTATGSASTTTGSTTTGSAPASSTTSSQTGSVAGDADNQNENRQQQQHQDDEQQQQQHNQRGYSQFFHWG